MNMNDWQINIETDDILDLGSGRLSHLSSS